MDQLQRKFLCYAGTLVLACAGVVVLGISQAGAQGRVAVRGPLVRVSPGPSPFAESDADHPEQQAGTVTQNSEVETMLVVNPTNPLNIVVTYQQDRWSNGGARGDVVAASFDGGQTFTTVPVPGITATTGGPFLRGTDPWLSFASNGDLYVATLLLSGNPTQGFSGNAVAINKSTDGGLTWSDPILVDNQTDPNILFEDKESVTVDPNNPNLVYVIWDQANQTLPQSNGGPIFLSRSTDGGNSYGTPQIIADFGDNRQTVGNIILVRPDGVLANFFAFTVGLPANPSLFKASGQVIFSRDQGRTWSEATRVAKFLSRATLTTNGTGVYDPQTGALIRAEGFIPAIALNPTNGDLYVVWQDTRFSTPRPVTDPHNVNPTFLIDEIAFSQSTDGGRSWSQPIKINKTLTNIAFANRQAFLPAVAVAADGTVAVTYYDFRNNDPTSGQLGTDYFVVFHQPGIGRITDPNAWGPELRLTDETFDMHLAPEVEGGELSPSGFFLGDYTGLTTVGNEFVAAFSQSSGQDPANVFFCRFGLR
jgi:hypothetical protein